ncbi:MAG: hypothetical protein R6W76_19510 [Caldilinea sp.]
MNLAVPLNFTAQAQAAGAALHKITAPFGFMITAVSLTPIAFTGTPTGFSIDVNVGATAALAALAADVAGTPVNWKSRHHQGDDEVIRVAKDATVTIDVNLTGGVTPTVTYDLILWIVQGTV